MMCHSRRVLPPPTQLRVIRPVHEQQRGLSTAPPCAAQPLEKTCGTGPGLGSPSALFLLLRPRSRHREVAIRAHPDPRTRTLVILALPSLWAAAAVSRPPRRPRSNAVGRALTLASRSSIRRQRRRHHAFLTLYRCHDACSADAADPSRLVRVWSDVPRAHRRLRPAQRSPLPTRAGHADDEFSFERSGATRSSSAKVGDPHRRPGASVSSKSVAGLMTSRHTATTRDGSAEKSWRPW